MYHLARSGLDSHMNTEVTVREEDALVLCQGRLCEELMARVTAFPASEVPNVFQDSSHRFVTHLLGQVDHFHRRLYYGMVISGKVTHVSVK